MFRCLVKFKSGVLLLFILRRLVEECPMTLRIWQLFLEIFTCNRTRSLRRQRMAG